MIVPISDRVFWKQNLSISLWQNVREGWREPPGLLWAIVILFSFQIRISPVASSSWITAFCPECTSSPPSSYCRSCLSESQCGHLRLAMMPLAQNLFCRTGNGIPASDFQEGAWSISVERRGIQGHHNGQREMSICLKQSSWELWSPKM